MVATAGKQAIEPFICAWGRVMCPRDAVTPPAEYWLTRLVILHQQGKARFPQWMGLDEPLYRQLLRRLRLSEAARSEAWQQQDRLIGQLQQSRQHEKQQLADWLQHYQAHNAAPMPLLVATASLGFDHLWQDLGLSSRQELRELMSDCFPELVVLNVNNMRWKKFFYRQRCMAEGGDLVCRSPSCDACSEWALCFGD